MSKRLVHVARNGNVIGQYPVDQLASLAQSGFFLDTDLCYSEARPEWTPMPEFLKKTEMPKFSMGRPNDGKKRGYAGRNHHSRQNIAAVLSGWIAFLLVLSALVGSGFWIAGLYSEIGQKSDQIEEMEKKLVAKEKENQRFLFVSREVAESGIVRGSVILRNETGKRVAMPGVQVLLYPRKVIENHLAAKAADVLRIPAGTSMDGNEFFTAGLPPATASTTTDASGRFEFPVPEPGEYVLYTRMNSFVQGAQVARIWFVAFNSQDPLNTLVQINETNSVQQFVPSLMIVEGR